MQAATTIQDCKRITLPKFADKRGKLSFVESERHIPFAIKRIFYLYDIPINENRGAHAHKCIEQFLIPIAGTFTVTVKDGRQTKDIELTNPSEGLYIPGMIWGELKNFSEHAVCLALASDFYDETEYLRSFEDFLKIKMDFESYDKT